jgi:hypothetical protein
MDSRPSTSFYTGHLLWLLQPAWASSGGGEGERAAAGEGSENEGGEGEGGGGGDAVSCYAMFSHPLPYSYSGKVKYASRVP